MSYNPNIPLVTDKILQSFGQLRANFRAINDSFADNHVPLNQNEDISGLHSVLTLSPVSDPTTDATQIALYNKLVSGVPAMFFRPSSNQTPIQMTYPSIKVDSSNTQYSFVAGPFIVYGGFLPAVILNQPVTLSPGNTLIYVNLTVANPGFDNGIKSVVPTNITGTSFNISFSTPAAGFTFDVYYTAVGQ